MRGIRPGTYRVTFERLGDNDQVRDQLVFHRVGIGCSDDVQVTEERSDVFAFGVYDRVRLLREKFLTIDGLWRLYPGKEPGVLYTFKRFS